MSRTSCTIPIDATFSQIVDAFWEVKVSALTVTAPNGEFMGIISKNSFKKVWKGDLGKVGGGHSLPQTLHYRRGSDSKRGGKEDVKPSSSSLNCCNPIFSR